MHLIVPSFPRRGFRGGSVNDFAIKPFFLQGNYLCYLPKYRGRTYKQEHSSFACLYLSGKRNNQHLRIELRSQVRINTSEPNRVVFEFC